MNAPGNALEFKWKYFWNPFSYLFDLNGEIIRNRDWSRCMVGSCAGFQDNYFKNLSKKSGNLKWLIFLGWLFWMPVFAWLLKERVWHEINVLTGVFSVWGCLVILYWSWSRCPANQDRGNHFHLRLHNQYLHNHFHQRDLLPNFRRNYFHQDYL